MIITQTAAERHIEALTLLALDLNRMQLDGDCAVIGKLSALAEADLVHVLAASGAMAVLMVRLAVGP